MRMGLREANQRFSKAVKAVRAGKEVVLTERGRPIAVIKPIAQIEDDDAVIRRLAAEGLVQPATMHKPMPAWRPRVVRGKPLSRTVRDERDDR